MGIQITKDQIILGDTANKVIMTDGVNGLKTVDRLPKDQIDTLMSTKEYADAIERYKKSNIIGTVSQTSGVPTGAIIERGSNANGDYVKFADGTMSAFCYRDLPATALSTSNIIPFYMQLDITLPVTFVYNSVVYCTAQLISQYHDGFVSGITGQTFSYVLVVLGAVRAEALQSKHLYVVLHGRWY